MKNYPLFFDGLIFILSSFVYWYARYYSYMRLVKSGKIVIKNEEEIIKEEEQKIVLEKQKFKFKFLSNKFSFLIPIIIGLIVSYFLLKYASWKDGDVKGMIFGIWLLVVMRSFQNYKVATNQFYQENWMKNVVSDNSPKSVVMGYYTFGLEFFMFMFTSCGIIILLQSYLKDKVINEGAIFLSIVGFIIFYFVLRFNNRRYLKI